MLICTYSTPCDDYWLIYDSTSRLTGSLALSIAYGIHVCSPENEFLRLFREMQDAFEEASVPGTFLVDIFPLRGSGHLNTDHRRPLTYDDLPQSSIYPPGSPACDSTHLQTKPRTAWTRPKHVPWRTSRRNSRLGCHQLSGGASWA